MKAKSYSFTTGTDKLRIEGSGPPGLVDSEWWIVDGSERDKEMEMGGETQRNHQCQPGVQDGKIVSFVQFRKSQKV